jgi:homoserine kinase
MMRTNAKSRAARAREIAVRVPASTANLGAGFDCFALALELYLEVRARIAPDKIKTGRVAVSGEGAVSLPAGGDNLILRAMQFVAEREGFILPPLSLDVRNAIPLCRGLGSSGAAIVAGAVLGAAIARKKIPSEKLLRYAAELEGHADNVAAALLGGWVTIATSADGPIVVRQSWPGEIRAVVVSPDAQVDTHKAREFLAKEISREDAVFNLQRAALFGAALAKRRYDLLGEAMRDRLHQPQRQSLVPGLAEALAIPPQPGLLGVALSGSGPSVLALATARHKEIGAAIVAAFAQHGVRAAARILAIDAKGAQIL